MIRVLQLPGSIAQTNGRMSVIMNIYRKMDRTKVQFDFLGTGIQGATYQEEIENLGGNVFIVPESKLTFFSVRRAISNVLDTCKYDFVHYHAISLWGSTIDIAKRRGIQVIVHSHSNRYTLGNGLVKTLRNKIFTANIFLYANKFVAVSTDSGKALFHKRNFECIPNVIDFSKFSYSESARSDIRKRYGLTEKNRVIGHVGRFSPEKNHSFMIETFSKIWEKDHNFRLMLIGDGPLLVNVKHQIKKLKLEKAVILVGAKSDVTRFYSVFDLFWLPSIFEGLPTVGLEAQAAGVPLIVSNQVTKDLQINPISYLPIDGKDSQIEWVNKSFTACWHRNIDFEKKLVASKYFFPRVLKQWMSLYMAV